MAGRWTYKDNSIDIIRLLAALQVALEHTWGYLHPEGAHGVFFKILALFPGVPIFFFLSGFLISRSFEKSATLNNYLMNRVLRLYPALIICVLINVIFIWFTGYFGDVGVDFLDVTLLVLAKTTFLQFYNPDFMRAFGDGVLNGSLWTICVEIQFYLLVPIIYRLAKVGGGSAVRERLVIGVIMILSLVVNRVLYVFAVDQSDDVLWKLAKVSFLPWVYMFLAGVLVQRNFEFFASITSRLPFLLLLFIYLPLGYFLSTSGGLAGNSLSPVAFILLAVLVFRGAYAGQRFVKRLLKGNDFSYGLYIWHMPIVNQLLFASAADGISGAVFAILLSVLAAYISWRLIERPSLRMKRVSIHAVN